MGQTVVDLPDPLEQPPAGASADDLLSQLAGDEIDRLLGESAERPDADEPAGDAAAPVAEAPPEAAPIAEQLEAAKADAAAEVVAVAPAASGELDQAIAAHADAVLGPAPADPPAAPATEPERDALLAIAADAADEDPESLPLLLRPLEWLSSPLDSLSPAAREFLGKAAIVTLVNSAAVIAYVIWFRK